MDMNGLEGGATTAASSRLMRQAYAYVLIAHRLHTKSVKMGGGDVSLSNPPPLVVVVIECGMCGGCSWSESCRAVR